MCNSFPRWLRVFGLLLVLLFVYLIVFPDDIPALIAPLERVFGLTGAVAFGAYMVIAVAIFSWAIVRAWRRV